jgi:hypothetical protein
VVSRVWTLLQDQLLDDPEVVAERYEITNLTTKATRQYDALEIIGALRFKCDHLAVPFKTYPRSVTKNLASNQRLKDLGLWTRNYGHVNDAVRVVLTHLAQVLPERFIELVEDAEEKS